jgi:hypothetical protein
MLEDPGASNFLIPLVEELSKLNVPLFLYGVGVGALQLRELGYSVSEPPNYLEAQNILKSLQCRLLVIGTSEDRNTPAFTLVQAARALSIQSIGIVDASVNSEFRFCGSTANPLANITDWLFVPDLSTYSAFSNFGFPQSRISIVGHPARDLARRRARLLSSGKNLFSNLSSSYVHRIVFVSELSEGLNHGQYSQSSSYTFQGRGNSSARTIIIAEELLDACSYLTEKHNLNTSVVLRLHPKQTINDFSLLSEDFDEISSFGDPLTLLGSSDLVVGMTSTLLVQAYDMGIPCLSILPRVEEKAWLPELSSGTIDSVFDSITLRSVLLKKLLSPRFPSDSASPIDCSHDSVSKMIGFLMNIYDQD